MTGEAATTEDAVLGGRLVLRQPRRGHRFGHDAILLAAATDAQAGEAAVDLGAGVGTAGIALAHRVPGLDVVLVEKDAALAALARENAVRNGLSDRVHVAELDVAASVSDFHRTMLPIERIQCVLMNPPFNDPARQNVSPDRARRDAHVRNPGTLCEWAGRARSLLLGHGSLTLIWRADGLAEVLTAMEGFGNIAVMPVYPKPSAPAIRVLVRAVKDSRAPQELLPGLTLNDDQGRPTAEAEAVLRQGSKLHMGSLSARRRKPMSLEWPK